MQTRSHIVPLFLAIVITVVSVWSGFNPTDRAVWYAEVMPIFAVFGLLLLTYPRFQFSGLAYVLMSLWMIMHLIGAKYTFANVPFDWANQYLTFLGEDRNHFDRVAHYIIGFYSFPMAEWLLRKRKCGLGVAFFFSLFLLCRLPLPMRLSNGNMR